jgi:hypothetical protein
MCMMVTGMCRSHSIRQNGSPLRKVSTRAEDSGST